MTRKFRLSRSRILVAGAVLIACLAVCGIALATATAPSDTPIDGYVTNGTVNSIVQSGDTTYLGGQFTKVGPRTGSFVGVSSGTAAYQSADAPEVLGTVDTVVSDGDGGWYIGGSFTAVGGVAIDNAAHINPDGTLDTSWNPSPEGQVTSIATNGTTVYLGGFIGAVNSTSSTTVQRPYLAAISADTGYATGWNPDPNSVVNTIALSGSTVYVGGDFSTIGGGDQDYVAALDSSSANLISGWAPAPNNDVKQLAVSSDGSTIYLAGSFSEVDSMDRYGAAAVDGVSADDNAKLESWSPIAGSGSQVQAIAISPDGGTVYLGGFLNGITGAPAPGGLVYAAAVNSGPTGTGSAVSPAWNPDPNGEVESISVSPDGNTVYLGGVFTGVLSSGTSTYAIRDQAAAISAAPGATYGYATGWDPEPASPGSPAVEAIAATADSVFMGGNFDTVNAVTRDSLAAMDDTTGEVTDWNPGAQYDNSTSTPTVDALALSNDGSTMYVGGNFNELGGVEDTYYAGAVSTSTGALDTAWDPGIYEGSSGVTAIAVGTSEVYVAGGFTAVNVDTVEDDNAHGLSAFNPTTGAVDASWDPNPNAGVLTLAVSGSTVYAGGYFTEIGTTPDGRVAALSATTAAPESWHPDANNAVESVAVSPDGSTVYLGGTFTTLGSTARNYAGAVGGVSAADPGQATSFDPDASGGVLGVSVAPDDSAVYLVGDFSSVNAGADTVNRNYAAAVDPTTGAALPWDPQFGSPADAIAAGSSVIAAGYGSTDIANLPQAYIGLFPLVASVTPPANPVANFDSAQNSTSLGVNFTDESTATSPASIQSWAWDFGDNDSSTAQNPTHLYSAAGTYTVKLTVQDSNGNSGTISQTVTVNAPPTAAFTSKQSSTSLAVQFTDASVTVAPATISSWAWKFGDGGTSNSETPSHTYAAAGTYPVTLTVTDSIGEQDTASANVVVTKIAVKPIAPVISALTQSAKSWRLGSALTKISHLGARKPKPPVGTTFTLKLSKSATVKLVVTRKGIKSGSKCVVPSKKRKSGKPCTITAGTIAFAGTPTSNKVKFDGRISKTKKLAVGSYTLHATATADKLTSKTKMLAFKIVG